MSLATFECVVCLVGADSTCPHAGPYVAWCCPHLLANLERPPERMRRFSGRGTEYVWVCAECADSVPGQMHEICSKCIGELRPGVGDAASFRGRPEVLSRSSGLAFKHRSVQVTGCPPDQVTGIAPVIAEARNLWLAFLRDGRLIEVDLDAGRTRDVAILERGPQGSFFGEDAYAETVATKLSVAESRQAATVKPGAAVSHRQVLEEEARRFPMLVAASPDGRYAAVCNRWGERGVVLDLKRGIQVLELKRNYHAEQTEWPVAFVPHQDGSVVVHASAWNRLDATDLSTGVNLVSRPVHTMRENDEPPPHYLDYFHGALQASSDGEWILDNGWIWHPVGAVSTWNLSTWFRTNVWESEDGSSKRYLCYRDYFWDSPACWLSSGTVAVWGFGEDDELMLDAARIFDARTGEELRWFAGPAGRLAYDKYLLAFGEAMGTSIWDAVTGERLLEDADTRPVRYHPGAKAFLSMKETGFTSSWLVGDSA